MNNVSVPLEKDVNEMDQFMFLYCLKTEFKPAYNQEKSSSDMVIEKKCTVFVWVLVYPVYT